MILEMILNGLLAKPARTFLTLLSIIIGVVSVLLIDSVSTAGTEVISNELSMLGIDCISITSADPEHFVLSNKDIETIYSMEGVDSVYAIYSQQGIVETDLTTGTTIFWGLSDANNHLLSLEEQVGRFITQDEINNAEFVCVIGQETATKYFGSDDVIGEKLSVKMNNQTNDFLVVGIVKNTNGLLGEVIEGFIPEIIYTPSTTLQRIYETEDLSQISVTLKNTEQNNVNEKILNIKRTLIAEHENSSVNIDNLTENKNSIIKITEFVKYVLTAIAFIAVIVACIGITNIMFVSVTERKREIGIKKAIGATKFQIGIEFITEGVLIALIGCLIGIGLSLIIAFIINSSFDKIRITVSSLSILISLICSVLFGVVFSLIPSYTASKCNPSEALKNL